MTRAASNMLRIAPDVRLGRDDKLYAFVNQYGCEIGAGSLLASGSLLTSDVPPDSVVKARAGSVVRPLLPRGQPPIQAETEAE